VLQVYHRPLVAAGLGLALAFAVFLAVRGTAARTQTSESSTRSAQDRKSAPEFELKDGDGKVVRLSDYKGKVVLLNFWATWCGPCKIEMPWFIEFERKYKDKGFAVVGVAMDEEGWQAVKPFLADMAVNYRVLLGSDQTAELYGGVSALPTTFLIDQEGKVASTHVGLAPRDAFENGIKELLEGKRAAGAVVVAGAN
jgi:cytochrome c biogenesis protein CcmG/thiol:disulfide interchange protein DsbE